MAHSITFDLHSHVIERRVKGTDYWKEAEKRKIQVMAMTEHAHFWPEKAFEIVAKYKPKNKILIPGIELNTNIGHVLCYSPSKKIYQEKKWLEYGLPIEEAAQLAEKHGCALSCAHPWGFQYDSAAFLIGPKKLTKLVKRHELGIEAYNGMVGHLSDIIFESGWVRRPVNFLDFLEKNKVTRKIGLSRVGKKMQNKVEKSIWNTLARISAGIAIGEKAPFITAGSDAHTADRIGEAMLKANPPKKRLSTKTAFELFQQKNQVTWCGVGVEETSSGVYKKIPRTKLKRWELWDSVKYATKRTMSERVWKKIKRKKKEEKNEV